MAAQTTRLQRNLQLLGIFWIAYSAISVLGGIVLVILANALFGPAGPAAHGGAPLFLQPMLTAIGIFLLIKAALGIAAGWGLIRRENWARILTVVLGFLALIHIPLGTALGIYTLWVLLSPGVDDEYRAMAAHA